MKVYIYNAKRSAIGKFKKGFVSTSCRIIGAQISKHLFGDVNITPKEVDKVYVGNVLSAGNGQNIARQILLDTGIDEDKCAATINMVCGSGLKAINLAYNDIVLGNAHCILAGGVENMSMSPLLKDRYDENKPLVDSMINDALSDIFNNCHMGITAENVASKYKISREAQDEFALESQTKTQNAINNNLFNDEIVPVLTPQGEVIEKDEFPRSDSSLEKLSSLNPAFLDGGTVTAGNASGINDGGAFLIIGDETIKEQPIAEIVDFSEVGCDPAYMGMGPLYAINKILEKNNLSINDIDLFEINEAFAAQSIAVINELAKIHNLQVAELKKKINVNGGAIALGHPVGASGARIVVTLVHEMKRRNVRYGIASLCIGGGMGIAVLIKNVGEENDIKK